MILTIPVFFIFASVLIIKSYKSKFKLSIGIYVLGITLIMLASLLYFSKRYSYFSPYGPEASIFKLLSRLRLNISSIMLIHTLGLAAVMFACFCFMLTFKNIRPLYIALFLIHMLCFIKLNTYYVQFKLYVMKYSLQSKWGIPADKIVTASVLFTYITIIFYVVLPYIILFHSLKKSTLYLKKRYITASSAILLLLNLIFLQFFIMKPFRPYMPSEALIAKEYPNVPSTHNYVIITMIIYLLLMAAFILLLYFNPFERNILFSRHTISKNTDEINKNMHLILHTYKNLFFTISQLALQASEQPDKNVECVENNLNSICTLADNSVKTLTKTLDTFRNIRRSADRIDLGNVLDKAVSEVNIPENIDVSFSNKSQCTSVYGDFDQIKEVFTNIITNAVEAIIVGKNDTCGHIRIETESDDNYAVITVYDNGGGITKDNYRNIFKPFFSTKKSFKNWGIGLSYCRQIINAHLGYIFVGKNNSGETYFQVLFPSVK